MRRGGEAVQPGRLDPAHNAPPLCPAPKPSLLAPPQILAAGAPPARVSLISPSFGRSYVLDEKGFVGGPGSPGPCMGAEGLLDQSEIALLVPPASAKLDLEGFANAAPFRSNEFTHFEDRFTLTSKASAMLAAVEAGPNALSMRGVCPSALGLPTLVTL